MVSGGGQDDRAVGDRAAVARLLGREPQADFTVVVRDDRGSPVVIRNAPFLDDGTPMPTRYYLVDPGLLRRIGALEADGGVRRAEAEIDPTDIEACHRRYALERDALVPASHTGPRPGGGVGGTRRGVKCLHAHYAHFLAGGDDPVGRWVQARLDALREESTATAEPPPAGTGDATARVDEPSRGGARP